MRWRIFILCFFFTAALPAADLLVGDMSGEVYTVAAGNTLDHTGTIWVFNDGVLDIRGTLNLTGSIVVTGTGQFIIDGGEFHLYGDNTNIVVGEQGQVIFRSGALWHYVQTYLSQHNLLCSGQAEVHVSDSEVDCDGSAEVIVMVDETVYTGTNVVSPDWKTWYLNDNTSLTLDNVNIGGDIVFTGSPAMSFTDTIGIMPWLHFGAGTAADLDFPDTFNPSAPVTMALKSSTPGVSGITWSLEMTDCYSVLPGVEPAAGCDVTLRDSFVGMILFEFTGPGSGTMSGILQNNSHYDDTTVPIADRNLRLINSDVQWWKVDVIEGYDLTADNIIFSEMMVKNTSSVHLTNSICEGQTIHMGAVDNAFLEFDNGEVWSDVSVWGNAAMVLRHSMVDYRKGEYIYQIRNIAHNNSRLYCLNTEFGYISDPSETLPEAMDSALAMFLYIDPPAAPRINSSVNITGSARIATGLSCAAEFDRYELAAAAEGSTLWTMLHSGTAPVEHGLLGIWDTDGLEPGLYTLRLTLYTSGDTAAKLPEEYPAERIIALTEPAPDNDNDNEDYDDGIIPGCMAVTGRETTKGGPVISILLAISGLGFAVIRKRESGNSMSAILLPGAVCAAAVMTGCISGSEDDSGTYDVDPGIRLTQVTADGGRVAWYTGPADHELVAFDRKVDEVTANTEVFIMQPDGTGITDLTGTNDTVPAGFTGQPAWHPDGEHIVFQSENANSRHMRYNHVAWGINNDLWIISRDGTGAEKIWETPLNHAALHAHFSSDGTRIIFAERESTGEVLYSPFVTPGGENPWAGWRIHIADFDISQTGTAKLSNHVTLFDDELPKNRGFLETHGFLDAEAIIFSRTLNGEAYVDDVFTSDLDGSSTVNLTQSPATWEEHGLYSPSGSSLCFISSRVNPNWQAPEDNASTLRTELYMKKDTAVTQLTHVNADGDSGKRYLVSDYEWDRTGKRIIFQVAPVDDVTGAAFSPEIWMLTFPAVNH